MSATTPNRMTLKHLESYLQTLEDFEDPKIALEQYATPPHIAALMLDVINTQYCDIEGKFVADLGCGTGRLSIGSVLCGARMVFGFDIDQAALDGALRNVSGFFADVDDEEDPTDLSNAYRACDNINFIQADISVKGDSDISFWTQFRNKFDTVIMNPPFGTKNNKGLDILFIETAIELAQGVVYSLHKTSTRDYILSRCQQWGVEAKPIGQFRYNLGNTYRFHKKKSVDIDVDLWRIVCH